VATAPPRKEPPLFDRLPSRPGTAPPAADGPAPAAEPPAVDGDRGALAARVRLLERENAQLREALRSRVLIEQSKGVLAERYRIDVEQAFELLRRTARSNRMRIHTLAGAVAASTATTRTADGGGPRFQRLDDQPQARPTEVA